ncbi:pyridoxal phosphate-dependent aminotransferase [Eubacteriales bacterium OttesenSCG-928-A19]|nr:pyridoxal phosphate-dependent aminotransferase [Eubacteriales bacterium OttesenSCG-928-A19]
MPLTISRRVAGITPSATLAIDARAKAMKAQGMHVLSFAAGEPDFPTPEYICDAAREAIAQGKTRYTPSSGIIELRQAVCEKLMRDNGLSYKPNQIIVSNGAKQSLINALVTILDPGDEVLLPAPCWLSYPEMIRMAGGVPMYIQTTETDDFLPSIKNLTKSLSPRTKAILINTPCNPTGAVYPEALLREIADFAVKHGLYIISDEIYEKLVYQGQMHISIASVSEAVCAQTIVINGVSKTFAMTGWRIGYAAGPLDVIEGMGAYQSHSTSNPNSIAQYAALEALQNGEAFIRTMHDAFDERRQFMVRRIAEIDSLSCYDPRGAFYIMLNCKRLMGRAYKGQEIDSALTLSSMLLEVAQVAVVPGDPFEAPGYCRLSYATSIEDISAGLDAIEAFIQRLS